MLRHVVFFLGSMMGKKPVHLISTPQEEMMLIDAQN